MRIHHLNCGTMCPFGGRLMDGASSSLAAILVCHCLLVETAEGLVLVDTGLGLRDAESPGRRLSGFFRAVLRPRLDPGETAARQIERLGFRRDDVRHIALTHLDFDHAGGIEDFPNAVVHVLGAEKHAAERRAGLVSKGRYRPAQWDEDVAWRLYRQTGERWFGFECVRELEGLPPEILLVPLTGHTVGHAGVAVATEGGWLLHAGDAYFYRDEMRVEAPHCTPGLEAYQTLMEVDRAQRLANQQRLRELVRLHGSEVTVFSAHDREEHARLAASQSTTTSSPISRTTFVPQ
jgi:glyoxylase-like metal-dependent hydrolase (beta-lactamase superfamily II)